MSSDIYISLRDVLTQPQLFELKLDYNVDIEAALDELLEDDPNHDYVADCLKPVLMCKFGCWNYPRPVDIVGNRGQPRSMHIAVGGEFRTTVMTWLMEHGIPYEVI